MFVTIFVDVFENLRRKKIINPSYPKGPKIIDWNKKWHKFLFLHFFVVPQKGLYLFEAQNRWVKIKNMLFLPLIADWDNKG